MTTETEQKNDRLNGEFTELVRPVMQWLNENYHPNVTVVIDPISAVLHDELAAKNARIAELEARIEKDGNGFAAGVSALLSQINELEAQVQQAAYQAREHIDQICASHPSTERLYGHERRALRDALLAKIGQPVKGDN